MFSQNFMGSKDRIKEEMQSDNVQTKSKVMTVPLVPKDIREKT
jgi:hypothetical protein